MTNIAELAKLWNQIAKMSKQQIVGRQSSLITDERVQPGYVGSHYETTRVLLMGMNPADDKADDGSENIYKAIEDLNGEIDTFQAYNTVFAESMKAWPLYLNVIQPLTEGLGITIDDVALLNVLPLKASSKVRSKMFDVAWNHVTLRQVELLTPKYIICLGDEHFAYIKTAWPNCRVYSIRRTTGDRTNLANYRNTTEDIERVSRLLNIKSTRLS